MSAKNELQKLFVSGCSFRPMRKGKLIHLAALIVCAAALLSSPRINAAPAQTEATNANSFPTPNEIFRGRTFSSKSERDVFFLRTVHQSYPMHWAPLLEANITVTDYVLAPDKLQRFIEELGTAMAGTEDITTITNLAAVTSDPVYYANTNVSRPEILRAASTALIKTGPRGAQALASSFSEAHYRTDSASLEVLADAVGLSGTADAKLTDALAATVFTFTATNGGSYPGCAREVTKSLLRLPGGPATVRTHLNAEEIFHDPGRFQAVVDGIGGGRGFQLSTNLVEMSDAIAAKAKQLSGSPGPYLDDLTELQRGVEKAIAQLRDEAQKIR
jgi:hypothetical protein